jgi:PAS domain S-box-containing protein
MSEISSSLHSIEPGRLSLPRLIEAARGYVIAVATVAAAMLLRQMLAGLIGRESPFLLCLIAVAVTTWNAGLGPGLLATALGTGVTGYYLFHESIHPGLADELLPLVFFVAIGTSLSMVASARRSALQARDRLLVQEREARLALERAHESLDQAHRSLAQAHEQLATSEDRYRTVARVSNDALWDWDVRADRVTRTDGMLRVFGYKAERVGTSIEWWRERIHPDDRVRVCRGFDAALLSDAPLWSDQYRFLRADGTYATVADRAYVIRHSAGHPLRMIGSMMDITELTQTQRALRESQQFFHRLVRAVPVVVVLLDPAGRITLFNRAAVQLTGYRRSDAMGKNFAEFLLDPDAAGEYRRRTADPCAAETRDPFECAVVARDGRRIALEWRFVPLLTTRSQQPFLLATGVEVRNGSTAAA